MKKQAFIPLLLAISILCSGCFYTEADIKKARGEAYEEGYENGLFDGGLGNYDSDDLDEAYNDGYRAGERDSSYDIDIILESARSYAGRAADDITLLDAMDIVSDYLDGGSYTKKEFEEAVNVLLHYAIYLEWSIDPFEEIVEDYDPFG